MSMKTTEGALPLCGFIVHAFARTSRHATQVCLMGRLENRQTFACIVHHRPSFFIRMSDRSAAEVIASRMKEAAEIIESAYLTMDGERCCLAASATTRGSAIFAAALLQDRIRTYEADIRTPEAFLMDRRIHGSVRIAGTWSAGRRVDRVYVDPELRPAEWSPELAVLSLDIETDPYGEEIWAIATHVSTADGRVVEHVFAVPARAEATIPDVRVPIEEHDTLRTFCGDERTLLVSWRDYFAACDPDIVTGWNVLDFDFRRLRERFRACGLPFDLGRSDEEASFLASDGRKPSTAVVPGRQVLDTMRIMRSGPERFSDQSLETAAQEILGRGKRIDARSKKEKLDEIVRMRREDLPSLCLYCLEDARLALDVFRASGLYDLTLRRCTLIGIPLSRAWTSIAAFDFLYIESMHAHGRVAPTLGVDALPLTEAPGGAIISPASGLFDNVLVFDFRSLYPSIIRTFNIDPLSYAGRSPAGSKSDLDARRRFIRAPNGAYFSREDAILPRLLERFFEQRAEAKSRGDATGAHVFKIIMNSFYGVLGASGSRFAGSDLAGAITGFGHEILYWCRSLFEELGHRTLYGDTDSLFVLSNVPRAAGTETLHAVGDRLCGEINDRLSRWVHEHFNVHSQLELEFEKAYARFFVPPMRGTVRAVHDGPPPGRAKGYAGLVLERSSAGGSPPGGNASAGQGHEDQDGAIEIKGMEAVRRDWTEAAKTLQRSLLRLVFSGKPAEAVQAFVRDYCASVRRGTMDERLIYTKALRKPVGRYTTSDPPHVRAARMLDAEDQSGLIEYVWTVNGPEPVSARTADIDYEHYIQKQLRPIAEAFSEVVGADLGTLFDGGGQLTLF